MNAKRRPWLRRLCSMFQVRAKALDSYTGCRPVGRGLPWVRETSHKVQWHPVVLCSQLKGQ